MYYKMYHLIVHWI